MGELFGERSGEVILARDRRREGNLSHGYSRGGSDPPEHSSLLRP